MAHCVRNTNMTSKKSTIAIFVSKNSFLRTCRNATLVVSQTASPDIRYPKAPQPSANIWPTWTSGNGWKNQSPKSTHMCQPQDVALSAVQKNITNTCYLKSNYPKSTLVDILRALFSLVNDLRFAACCDIGREVGVIGMPVHSVKR